jgi:microcystin degradation protein MlrC
MRVAIGGFYHETNTFSVSRTGLELFKAYQDVAGPKLIEELSGTNSEIGGMIDALEEAGHVAVPLRFASAVPSGMVEREVYDEILRDVLSRLQDASPVDAVCLSLHGAAATDGLTDADGVFVQAVREAVGPNVRLAVTLDYHANISPELISAADFVTVYRTYPHTDMADRGREAVRVITRDTLPAHSAFRKIPAITVPLVQGTHDSPMTAIMETADKAARETGTISNSIAMGFAYADSPHLGATILVYGDDAEAAEGQADLLANAIWAQRDLLQPVLTPLDGLPKTLEGNHDTPIIVVDPSDNIGGGSAGDGTEVLRVLLQTKTPGVISITDPKAAALCETLGLGGHFDMEIGARVDDLHGRPVRARGIVEWVGEASFENTGSYMTGFTTCMGLTGVIRVGGLRIVATSLRTMPFDRGVLTSVGIDPKPKRLSSSRPQ